MNRSFSKIRHIQETNQKIEERFLKEQTSDVLGDMAAGAAAGAATGAAVGTLFAPAIGTAGGALVGGAYGALLAGGAKLMRGTGTSDKKVKEFIALCDKSNVPITSNAKQNALRIYNAITGIGTNEEEVYNVFKSFKDVPSFCSTVKAYNQSYNNLFDDLDGDFNEESEWNQIANPLRAIVVR